MIMIKNKLAIYIVVGSGFIGGLLGIVPPMMVPASTVTDTRNDDTTKWKSVKIAYYCTDSMTIEAKVQDIEKMMSVDMTLMTTKRSASSDSNHNIYKNLYKYDEVHISDAGRKFIREHEALSLTAYKLRGESRYTIGYGHVIYEENYPHKISKREAERLFNSDMDKFENAIQSMLGELDHRFVYSQGFVDGLASLTYNCGPDGVKRTRFWKRMKACRYDKSTGMINQKDLEYAISAVKTANISSIYKKGHTARRSHEHDMMAKK